MAGEQRPRKFYVVVEKKTDELGTQVNISRVFIDPEDAERERQEISEVCREMDGWDQWSVGVRELHCHDEVSEAEPISERRHKILQDAADATASALLGGDE